MNNGHSPWGGSSRKRYRICPGSVALATRMPSEPDTEFAWRGTVTHALAEHCLREGDRAADEYHGRTEFSERPGKKVIPVDADMIATVNVYLDAVYAIADGRPSEIYVEHSFTLDVAVPGAEGRVYGSTDCAIYLPDSREWHFLDLKNGYEDVDVEDNDQAKFYAAGGVFAENRPVRKVTLWIVQPNGKSVDIVGAVKSWEIEAADVLDELEDITKEVARTLAAEKDFLAKGSDPRNEEWRREWLSAGAHCRYCPARTVCVARELSGVAPLTQALPEVKDVASVKPIDLPLPTTLDIGRIGKLLEAFDTFEPWMKMVRDHALSLATGGTAIPGFKLVDKIARSKWAADPHTISAYLQTVWGLEADEVMPPTLVGITEIERLLAKSVKDKAALKAAKDELRARYVDKSSSGYNLVAESHKGEARMPAALMSGVNV